ncbi:hypothetical protein TI39_contig4111g00012 [Zymoseptoria brevis]|uniref:F-box domain-containing protein n=1 Tax=Zymoseptoria brevis TaxID=1047168 RepID=A0A0F4GH13_9PEZI|nr:hypothetical protein TI39_contig4111g00012 [Zymoseptoria brevis]
MRNADTDTDVSQAPATAPDKKSATGNAVESAPLLWIHPRLTQWFPQALNPISNWAVTATRMFLSKNSDYELIEEAVSFFNSPDAEDSGGEESGEEEVTDLQISPVNTPNCHKALETREICEQVLNTLSELEILRSLRVSRGFKATIKGSITLQRRILLASDYNTIVGKAISRDPR